MPFSSKMAAFTGLLFFLVASLASLLTVSSAATAGYYTAAVYEHARFGARSHPGKEIVDTNLFMYKKAAAAAKSKGADIIVYPEYGIFPPGNRQQLKEYLERIPDPKTTHSNPCEESGDFSHRLILQTLSCIAKNNSIFLVANMGDIQDCTGEPNCSADGVFHFNTNVVFDRNGSLLLKYHKEYLFFELGMDLAREQQDPIFETEFGTFATFTSFDIFFKRMILVAQRRSVDGVLFPSMWVDVAPLYTSVQFWQSWALGNNVTLLASNIHIPGYFTVGCGIFHGQAGALGYVYNTDGISKLIVTRVPKLGNPPVPGKTKILAITSRETWNWKKDGKDVPQECSTKLLNNSANIYKDYRCLDENTSNYTFVKLTERSDHLEACNNGMCCILDYTAVQLVDNFYLGVYNNSHNSRDRYFWWEENCILVRCEAMGDNPCATFPMKSKTVFHHVQLRANFSTQYVYPSIVNSGIRLVPRSEWRYELTRQSPYEGVINFKNQEGKNLIVLGFKGRCYDRDPPYVR